jgi:uncharacterized membrane protein YGL010W
MKKQKAPPQRPIDILFDKYTASHQNPVNQIINWICVPLVVFAVLGLAYAIPFPHLGFLGQYNAFINWDSLVIAFSIYFYMRMSPVLSYIMLIVEFLMGYGVLELDNWQKANGPNLVDICILLLFVCLTAQYIGQKIERKPYSLTNSAKFQFYAPIWLLSLVLKRFNVKY